MSNKNPFVLSSEPVDNSVRPAQPRGSWFDGVYAELDEALTMKEGTSSTQYHTLHPGAETKGEHSGVIARTLSKAKGTKQSVEIPHKLPHIRSGQGSE